MVSDAPPFWWMKPDWRARLLWPLSLIYGAVAGVRMERGVRAFVPVPVICVGNFTVGGAGKTPTAIALARAARDKGLTPGFLSRGYGGSLDVTTVVDPAHHHARAVGDEPLLLAREALTVICRRRVEGARRLVAEGADIIIMDDGFQSARLAFDYALLVVDSHRSIGNGFLVPAGPVRAPVALQIRQATALLKVGNDDNADALIRRAARAGKPFHAAAVAPVEGHDLSGRDVLAFAGIADPEKFYRSLRQSGAQVKETLGFPDHHHLTDDEIADILARCDAGHLLPVTTAKDHVRLGAQGPAAILAARARVLDIEMRFEDPSAPGKIIMEARARARPRLLRAAGT